MFAKKSMRKIKTERMIHLKKDQARVGDFKTVNLYCQDESRSDMFTRNGKG
jgi:hypothetical protein